MPFTSGYVTGTTSNPAHYKFLDVVRNFAVANGWKQLMYDGTSANRYVFLRGPGLTGNDPVWVGLDTYQSVSGGYYNIAVACSNGYLTSQDYYNQPQMKRIGVPLFYDRVDYWLHINAQRIIFVCKVGQTYYEHGYIGKFIPYLSPIQYPYPAFVGGMFGYGYSSENYILQNQKYSYSSYHYAPYYGTQYRSGGTYGWNGQVYSSFDNAWSACEKITVGSDTNAHSYLASELLGNRPIYNIDLAIIYDSDSRYQLLRAGTYGTLDGVYLIDTRYPEIYAEDTFTAEGKHFIAFPPYTGGKGSILLQTDD